MILGMGHAVGQCSLVVIVNLQPDFTLPGDQSIFIALHSTDAVQGIISDISVGLYRVETKCPAIDFV